MLPGWLGKQASSYVGANSQFFLFFLFYHQKKIAGRIEIRSFVRNKVAIGRTCGWIESYALKFFKSGFMDKPSAKRRRNAISQSKLRSPLRSFRTSALGLFKSSQVRDETPNPYFAKRNKSIFDAVGRVSSKPVFQVSQSLKRKYHKREKNSLRERTEKETCPRLARAFIPEFTD